MDQKVKTTSFKDQMCDLVFSGWFSKKICDLVFELDILGEGNLNKWNYNKHFNQTKMVNNEFIYLFKAYIGNKQPTF